jgi:hypothetical protein
LQSISLNRTAVRLFAHMTAEGRRLFRPITKGKRLMSDTQNAPAPAPEPNYVEVTLNRSVEVQGHVYRPGVAHVVDEPTLAAMGAAVESHRPVTN